MNNKPPPPLHVKTAGFGPTTVSPTSPSLCYPASSTGSVAIKENPQHHLHKPKQQQSSTGKKQQQQNGLCGCCHRSPRSHCVSAIGKPMVFHFNFSARERNNEYVLSFISARHSTITLLINSIEESPSDSEMFLEIEKRSSPYAQCFLQLRLYSDPEHLKNRPEWGLSPP